MQPVDVVAVGARAWERERGPGTDRCVKREHFAEYDGKGAAVEQGVVKRPDEAVLPLAKMKQGEAHERRLVHGEAAPPVIAQPCGHAAFTGIGRGFAPVLPVPGRVGFLPHLLHGLGLPVKGGAEDRMAGDDVPPCRAKGLGVDLLAQGADHLLDVHAAAGSGEGVEEHAVLERRRRIFGFDFALGHRAGTRRIGRKTVLLQSTGLKKSRNTLSQPIHCM